MGKATKNNNHKKNQNNSKEYDLYNLNFSKLFKTLYPFLNFDAQIGQINSVIDFIHHIVGKNSEANSDNEYDLYLNKKIKNSTVKKYYEKNSLLTTGTYADYVLKNVSHEQFLTYLNIKCDSNSANLKNFYKTNNIGTTIKKVPNTTYDLIINSIKICKLQSKAYQKTISTKMSPDIIALDTQSNEITDKPVTDSDTINKSLQVPNNTSCDAAQLLVPEESKRCACCKNWLRRIESDLLSPNGVSAKCNYYDKETESRWGTDCTHFVPDYGKIAYDQVLSPVWRMVNRGKL